MTVSVVIPTWCEASDIDRRVRSALGWADEVVVADAGSPDGTADLARAAGAVIVTASKGRGAQLCAGADAARGDVLWFLHADVEASAEARRALDAALADDAVLGGNFRIRFEPASASARAFSWANDARRRHLGIYYGDSGIFVRRSVYGAIGGFRGLPVFEDYDFARRLEAAGRTVYVEDVALVASARRFRGSPLRTLAVWTLLQVLYSSGFPAPKLARLYADIR